MALVPLTFYVIACDVCGIRVQSDDEDLLLNEPTLCPRAQRYFTTGGWVVADRIWCPDCAPIAVDLFMHRLETETTHDPLF